MNWVVSGAGSIADVSASYNEITKGTALNLLSAVVESEKKERKTRNPKHPPSNNATVNHHPIPFVFISAAEAGWPEMRGGRMVEACAPHWLKRYLAAKRAVEAAIMAETSASSFVRGVIMRPSFVWSWSKLDILLPTFLFSIFHTLGVPFIDHPVRLDTIASAALNAIEDGNVKGAQRYPQMESLARKQNE